MKSPSLKNLVATFNLSKADAQLIKELCMLADDRSRLAKLIETHCSATWKYAQSCYGDPFNRDFWRRTLIMHAVDKLLGTHGVEYLGVSENPPYSPPYEYCNTGDSYGTTLIYKRATDTLFIGCWGDIVEREGED